MELWANWGEDVKAAYDLRVSGAAEITKGRMQLELGAVRCGLQGPGIKGECQCLG
jgi:hypothetical protein